MNEKTVIDALERLIQAIAGSFDLDTLLQEIIQTCTDISNASMGSLFLYNETSKELERRAEVNKIKSDASELRFATAWKVPTDLNQPNMSLTVLVFLTGNELVLNSKEAVYQHPARSGVYDKNRYPEGQYCQSWVGIPIKDSSSGRVIGVIKVENVSDGTKKGAFLAEEIDSFRKLASVVSKVSDRIQSYNHNMDTAIRGTQILLAQNTSLEDKLKAIVETFDKISQADGTSIWLREGSLLKCRHGSGHYQKIAEKKSFYEMEPKDSLVKLGVTAWIAKEGKMVHTKARKELLKHPEYKGQYDSTDLTGESESFLGVPLTIHGGEVIGIIKASIAVKIDTTKTDATKKFFTDEDARIFRFLSVITTFAVQSHRHVEAVTRHDRRIVQLYTIGSKCSELENRDEILWHLLIGLTHGKGIGFNRAMLFDIEGYGDELSLKGKMAIGHLRPEEAKEFQERVDTGKDEVILEDCLSVFRTNQYHPPESNLQRDIRNAFLKLDKNSQVYAFLKSEKTEMKRVDLNQCMQPLKDFFKARGSLELMVFSLSLTEEQRLIGFCDYVYTPESERERDALELGNIFLKQIELAFSSLNLRKREQDTKDKAWQEFSASIAHRMGTETANMTGALAGIRRIIKVSDESKALGQATKRIEQSIERLNLSLRDYKELGRVDKLKQERVDVIDLINHANTLDVPEKKAKNIAVEVVVDQGSKIPTLIGDNEKLLYTFTELLHNAFRSFEDKKEGRIQIRIGYDLANKVILIDFIDNGSGIRKEHAPKIFQRGERFRKGGTGLGLSIVKKYIEAHGGTVVLMDSHEGAHFSITLPVREEQSLIANKRILLVEDTENLALDIQGVIGDSYPQLPLEWVNTEKEGLTKVINNHYDVILTDVVLDDNNSDDMGGVNILCKAIQTDKGNKVIIITSHTGRRVTNNFGKELSLFEYCQDIGAFACIDRNMLGNYLDEVLKQVEKALFG